MNEIVLAAGSVAGVFTAMAIDRTSQVGAKLKHNESMMSNSCNTFELEKRVVYEAMRRVYDYERAGKITRVEREKLLEKYRLHLNALNAKMANLNFNGNDANSFKADLIALVDQRMAQINAKLDDFASKMNNGIAPRQIPNTERKEEKAVVQKNAEQFAPADTSETSESDASLDEIKKQIMQTLSRLEQAEVE